MLKPLCRPKILILGIAQPPATDPIEPLADTSNVGQPQRVELKLGETLEEEPTCPPGNMGHLPRIQAGPCLVVFGAIGILCDQFTLCSHCTLLSESARPRHPFRLRHTGATRNEPCLGTIAYSVLCAVVY